MIKFARAPALILLLATLNAGSASAAADAALLKDLTSVILLLGLPCGEVVSAKNTGDDEHVAVCSNGARYRVYVNAEGRVVAEKQ